MFFGARDATSRARRERRVHLDPIVKLVVTHWILGAATGAFCAGILLVFDVAGLRTLLLHDAGAGVGLALLFGGFAITFGGVVAATAVMFIAPEQEPEGTNGGRKIVGDGTARPPSGWMRLWLHQHAEAVRRG